ncbi:hypothetical protein GJW-30_1_03175 [Variibacter gotjawalensis]|uniref:Uncharacterized protein n=1 Tax=Variibacter gotjawalensis TaxID=1333996 RepID=A0A0S3PXK3_9BRAD|nr:hypothetical protein [Variibacter gotjawalensis]NIK46459.1 hypothetical protein [Variibacter gotjawalensis]RZS48369.1 hypothetical protein EV661_0779 [Variibacter gotjawalensis]BAT60627.1 hypothetical protein GJW-30_1_03175 [Variibacter gotjawalensis]
MLKRLALSGLLFVVAISGAQALEESRVQAIKQASDELVALAGDSAKTGNPPRITDPKVADLLKRMTDTKEIEGTNTVPFAQIPLLTTWNTAVLTAFRVYVGAGTDGMTEQQKAVEGDKNIVKFQNETGSIVDAMLRLQAAIIDTAQGFVASATPQQLENPNVKNGLGMIANGAAQTMQGFSIVLTLEGLTDAWREARIPAIIALAPRTAKVVSPEAKTALRNLALAAKEKVTSAKVKAAFDQIASALQ